MDTQITLSGFEPPEYQEIRFLDDWAYQANVRQELEKPDINELKYKMKAFENIIAEQLDININTNYNFPWRRLFEVEVNELN